MLSSKDGLAASDVIRSMMRLGFHRDEIYDTLAGIGLPGEQVQLLIDRVSVELEDAKLEPRASRLAAEVREVFEKTLERTKIELTAGLGSLTQRLEELANELEKLEARVVELQAIISGRELAEKT